MDFFARLTEQAKDLWSKPAGKWLLGGAGLFLAAAVIFSLLLTRPAMQSLGTVDATDAPRVAARLDEEKIRFTMSGAERVTFAVSETDAQKARLLMAELNLDPNSAVWSTSSWQNMQSWSNTDFDKRRLWMEQMESNLVRSIRALSDIENARVQISLPEPTLFREQQKPPKASVVVFPVKGKQLAIGVVEAIMETVAGAVEGLDRSSVVVVDASTSRVVSNDAFKQQAATDMPGAGTDLRLAIEKQYQDRWQNNLTTQLERVLGPGNVAVIVQPNFNWDRVMEEVLEHSGAGQSGKGIILSEQTRTQSSEGTGVSNGTAPAGTTPNADSPLIPGYLGAAGDQDGSFSNEDKESIINYLVNSTKRITEKPGGAIDEIAVGILVNQSKIEAGQEAAIASVVTMAMGSKARVEVAAMAFAPSPLDQILNPDPVQPVVARTPDWLIMLLVAALTLGGIGFFFVFFKPRRPLLEPVFAGPEAAMMGGIPVNDLELAAASNAYAQAAERVLPDVDVSEMAPEEIALLGDEFLQRLGIDPAKVRMREKVEKLAKGNPEAVASLIKTWMSEG